MKNNFKDKNNFKKVEDRICALRFLYATAQNNVLLAVGEVPAPEKHEFEAEKCSHIFWVSAYRAGRIVPFKLLTIFNAERRNLQCGICAKWTDG